MCRGDSEVTQKQADALDLAGSLATEAIKGKYELIMTITLAAIILGVILIVACIVVSKKRSKALIKSISHDLSILANAAEEIANGNVHAEINYEDDNEIGDVAAQLKTAIEIIGSYIDDIQVVMSTMAQGDFDVHLSQEFLGDFKNIENAIEQFSTQLSNSMNEIAKASEQQTMSVKQLDEHVADISSVGETNVATSEESSALSQELNGQADSLKKLVGQFRLRR